MARWKWFQRSKDRTGPTEPEGMYLEQAGAYRKQDVDQFYGDQEDLEEEQEEGEESSQPRNERSRDSRCGSVLYFPNRAPDSRYDGNGNLNQRRYP